MDSKFSLQTIDDAVAYLLERIAGRKVIVFHGEMGAGKTTFITALCNRLGVSSAISSPTFSIINEYKLPDGSSIFHLDLYRLKDAEEALQAGVEDCFYSGSLCLVEWPEIAAALLPEDAVHCYLTQAGNYERNLQIKV